MSVLRFDPSTPYPLFLEDEHSYVEAQLHSEEVDQFLGLRVAQVEKSLQGGACRPPPHSSGERQELWIGLASRSLLTPYTEIRQILARLHLKPGMEVVDLGAAYGRMGFVIDRHHPGVKFLGYEYVGERVKEGLKALERLHNPLLRLEHVDLSSADFSPEPADFYFIYDFGNFKAVEKILHELRRIAQARPITVVGRGRLGRDLIERRHPWLSAVVTPEHHGHSSIYRSASDASNS